MRLPIGVLCAVALAAGLAHTSAAALGADQVPPPVLSDPVLRAFATGGAALPGTTLNVEVYGSDLGAVERAISTHGGRVYGEVPGHLLAATVPATALDELVADPAVLRVTRLTRTSAGDPAPATALATASALSAIIEETMQLDDWHDAGYRGAGQRIGILDVFGADDLADSLAAGRLPQPAGMFCLRQGEPCDITSSPSAPHGVGVAEIAHATAPDAELYLATVFTLSDLNAAIDWFVANGVTIVNRSETSEFDGPGDGTGPLASIVDRAIAADMVWVAAAGNAGGIDSPTSPRKGENWIGTFTDTDGNGIHEWADGGERLGFGCGFLLGMRWDDWDTGDVPTDYDIAIYDNLNSETPRGRGATEQATPADLPLEHVDTRCKFTGDTDYIEITRAADIAPDGDDQIQIMGNFTPLDEWVNPRSATGPGAESANPGAITVGATRSPASFFLASYSSQGPTIDGRMNPDLIGPSCLPVTGFFGCFSGTSASAPFVAGVLAVLREAGIYDAAIEADSILPLITADQGPFGPDSMYGHGALAVPPPSELGIVPVDFLCLGLQPTIVGTSGPDVLEGTDGVDVIFGGGGNDVITGRDGADVLCGGDGRDLIRGGAGGDRIDGGDDRDRIWGEQGADVILGGAGGDILLGNVGMDEIRGEGGNDRVKGGAGDDTNRGGAGRDRLIGGPGDDVLHGGVSTDVCFGAGPDEAPDAGDRFERCER